MLAHAGLPLKVESVLRPASLSRARELGFKGIDGPLATTERKIRADRPSVQRFVQAYVEAVHYFKTNKPGTIRILKKYMRGLTDDDLGIWLDDVRESTRSMPYPDEEALRAELNQIGVAKSFAPATFVNTTFLDELQKSGFTEKLSK